MKQHTQRGIPVALAALAAFASACTPTIRTGGTTGSGGATGTGMDAAVDVQTVRDVYVPADTTLPPSDGACSATSANAESLPLDLYVMMDSSKSMLDVGGKGTTTTKWDTVRAAMTAFLNDPQSNGISVGIQYFPQIRAGVPNSCGDDPTTCGNNGPCDRNQTAYTCLQDNRTTTNVAPLCDATMTCTAANETCKPVGVCPTSDPTGHCAPVGTKCTGGDTCTLLGYCRDRDTCESAPYAAPAVAIATLPGAAAGLIASLGARTPDGRTPTAAALTGALTGAQQRAQSTPDHKAAVLFVTDGLPEGCLPLEIPGIADLAKNAATGKDPTGMTAKPSVPTFIIGVFSPTEAATATTNLNMLASSGGTGAAVVINTNQTEAEVRTALQTALAQVRKKALACEYKIPPPSSGAIDFNLVNVDYTKGAGGTTRVGYVKDAASCDATKGGWHYDVDPDGPTHPKPTSIIACPSTCTQFQGDMTGRVDIAYGCVRVTIQ